MNSKPFYLSGTIISAIVSALAQLAAFFHVNIADLVPAITQAIGDQVNATLAIAGVVGAIYGRFKATKTIKPLSTPVPVKTPLLLVLAAGTAWTLSGCAGTTVATLVNDAANIVTTAAATAADIDTVANAVEANNNGQPLNVATVVSDAEAAATSLNSSNLAATAESFANAINQTITDAQAAGASTQATVNVVAAQTAAAQVAASTATASTSTTFVPRGSKYIFSIAKD